MVEKNLGHPSFKEIVEKQKAKEKKSKWQLVQIGLALAIIANIIDILSWVIMPQVFGAVFLALRGLHVVVLAAAAIILGITGIKDRKTRMISIITIILGIVAFWPYVRYDWSAIFGL